MYLANRDRLPGLEAPVLWVIWGGDPRELPRKGPNSRTLLNRILKNPVDGLDFYSFADNKVGDMVVSVAGSGFTGELGSAVVVNGEEVGKVSSFTYGYTCEKYCCPSPAIPATRPWWAASRPSSPTVSGTTRRTTVPVVLNL